MMQNQVLPEGQLTLIQAIARQEGFYVPGSRAARNNNPGNLNFESWQYTKYGAVLETPYKDEEARFAYFKLVEDGFDAMKVLLREHYLGLSLEQVLNKWAPPSDGNDVSSYAANVCTWTGLTLDSVVDATVIG